MIAFYGLDGMHLVIVLVCFVVLVRSGVRVPATGQSPPVPEQAPPRVLYGVAP
jgi:hypothetical protein